MHITDFFDLSLLSQVMTEWSKATGMATIAMDADGDYISGEIGFKDFCTKYTRGTKEGLRRCVLCDSNYKGVYYCHAGLMDFSFDIKLDDGTVLGKIIGGQILSSEPNYDNFIRLADELGIDRNEYLNALKNIEIRSEEAIRASAYLLDRVVNLLVNSEYIKYTQKNVIKELDEANKRDVLTNVYNKRYCQKYLEYRIGNKTRVPFALLLIDIDNFKEVNDNWGHICGDHTLIDVVEIIKSVFKEDSVIGRFGGDEFMVIMKNTYDKELVYDRAKDLCEAVRKLDVDGDVNKKITISIGISFYPDEGASYESLMQKADEALYSIKNNGKDGYA
ncbi:MAG: diguanylate cyclase [Lachnospira sp.]|nr:diguanylate cyclase [Lachnospira sp.]